MAGGPIGKVRDGDTIEIVVDRSRLDGTVNLVEDGRPLSAAEMERRDANRGLQPDPRLPDDTRLWASLQQASGGTWGGCVYDVDAILGALRGK